MYSRNYSDDNRGGEFRDIKYFIPNLQAIVDHFEIIIKNKNKFNKYAEFEISPDFLKA